MRLIAKKPCSFGGRKFFIGEQIPENLVADPASQEKLGVLVIAKDESKEESATGTFTQNEVDRMIAEAITEFKEGESELSKGVVMISVKGDSEGENELITSVPVTQEEIQQVFSVMQSNADEGMKIISGVKSESVLILLHATDSRKTIKEAAKKQADNLFSAKDDSNEASTGNETTDTNTEGVDT